MSDVTAVTDQVPSDALDDLIALLELEPLEVNLFRGVSPDEDRQRVFGGQVAAQALVAAGRTVEPDRRVHSLHAYFLRPGDPNVPIIYEVDRIRDGRCFTTRRVVAIQHGRAIFNLAASFQIVETRARAPDPMPDVPTPTSCRRSGSGSSRTSTGSGPEMVDWLTRERPIDSRPVDDPKWLEPGTACADPGRVDPRQRHVARRPAAARVRRRVRVRPHAARHRDAPARDRATTGNFQMASLDHAMWFHRPFRADEWLLYHQKSPSASGARGLALGHVFAATGARRDRDPGGTHPADRGLRRTPARSRVERASIDRVAMTQVPCRVAPLQGARRARGRTGVWVGS